MWSMRAMGEGRGAEWCVRFGAGVRTTRTCPRPTCRRTRRTWHPTRPGARRCPPASPSELRLVLLGSKSRRGRVGGISGAAGQEEKGRGAIGDSQGVAVLARPRQLNVHKRKIHHAFLPRPPALLLSVSETQVVVERVDVGEAAHEPRARVVLVGRGQAESVLRLVGCHHNIRGGRNEQAVSGQATP